MLSEVERRHLYLSEAPAAESETLSLYSADLDSDGYLTLLDVKALLKKLTGTAA